MELVSAFALAAHETSRLQHLEVLRDRLSRHPEFVLHREPGAQLEQRLAVSIVQLVENRPSRRRRERVEDIAQCRQYKQVIACLSRWPRSRARGSALAQRSESHASVSPAVTADNTGEASALAAAQAVARRHGVACDEAVRIAGSNVVVHLKPAPVVARVMTATAVLHDDVGQWLAREVAVGAFAAERSDVVVAPSDILPPGPHEQDGLWLTLWQFVAHDAQAPPPEARQLGRSLRSLHAVLADFAGDLPPLSETRDWLARLLAELRPSPWLTRQDIHRLRCELDALTPAVFERSLPSQALHGDASMSNLLRTESGPVWIDLEDVCAGPVAWDVAGLVTSARARGQSAEFIEELLAAYGEPGIEDLQPFLEAHVLYEIVWQAFEARRRPCAMKRAAASLAHWREG